MSVSRNRRKTGLVLALILILGALFQYWLYPRLAIMSGYSAKLMCSCKFISGLDEERIREIDLGFSPISFATVNINPQDSSVTASVLGMNKQKAVYRKGMGCALVHNLDPTDFNKPSPKITSTDYSWTWPVAKPMDIPGLDSLMDWAFTNPSSNHPFNTRAVVIIKDGHLVAERYAEGISPSTPLLGWSMTKSLTATHWARRAYQKGLNLDDDQLHPAWNGDKASISWRNLLQMQPGFKWVEDYGSISNATRMLFQSDSMGAYTANQPLEFEPGEHWEYSSGTTNLLSYLLSMEYPSAVAYRKSIHEDLLYPIGATSFVVEPDAAGYFVGSSYGFASARDWAKLAQLYLNRGIWNGDTLFDPSFVDFVTTPASDSKKQYGGQFWLNEGGKLPDLPKDAYYMDGFHGQRVFIVPSENLIVVRLGVTYNPDWIDFNYWLSGILESLRDVDLKEKEKPRKNTSASGARSGT